MTGCQEATPTETDTPAVETATPTAQETASKIYEGENFTITIPANFQDADKHVANQVLWEAVDYETTKFSINVSEVGANTFVNDTLSKTFDEWVQNEFQEEGVSCEKILFQYEDGDQYETVTKLAKVTYSEGSSSYELAKTNNEIENINFDEEMSEQEPVEMPKELVTYTGRKVIIDKADRSKAIVVTVSSDSESDVKDCEEVLASFTWKD